MSSQRLLFTILTPTYNRAHTLERVYRSLCEQTFRNFEWLVIDDGSTDSTAQLIQGWRQEASFPVRYIWQENMHKKAAFNRGVKEAHGELIVALDSDDSLDVNALYTMAQVWHDMLPGEREDFVAIIGLCARADGRIVGDMFPADPFDVTSLDLTFKYGIKGEKFGCLRTHVLRQFPFPEEVPGFVPESLVWRAMARNGYLTRFVNQVFRVYHDSSDSISVQGKSSTRHSLGLWLLARDTITNCLPWFRYRPIEFFKAAARYTRFGLHLKDQEQKSMVTPMLGRGSKFLVFVMWPVGALLYLRDRWTMPT